MQLVIRVDVDTRIGLREGVPRLLDLFGRFALSASFFVSFGPDRSGKALRRLWQPGFLEKMWRTNALSLYGFRTLFSGTLLPSLPVGEGAPELLRDIVRRGHELGIHGYDHVRWQDRLEGMAEGEIETELNEAMAAYERILEARPLCSAAPGWRCTPSSLRVQDRLGFDYASDVRGSCPFLPVHNGQPFKTLQIPTTLPTTDELIGRQDNINDFLLSSLKEGLNVHTVHAEVEGRPYLSLFEGFLEEVCRWQVEIISLREVAEVVLKKGLGTVPHLPVTRGTLPGRSGWVACQGAL
ncbi:MAG: 4-deoxy-4-formamido-L-arabinose-phosphoundecaprenol deformylase [Deltaproteobacteria bacterium]|nr:4-deoxy-4-formamido-L-arabinose-phosphoundecaprenol deformylase [Deltaproteobacteria bacterium]